MCSIGSFALLIMTSIVGSDPGRSDAGILIDTMEALQLPVEDFRCEFEGTVQLKGDAWKNEKTGDGGLLESFNGAFIWRRGGDIHSETFHRQGFNNVIKLESVVVRMKQNQAERYERANDAPLGFARIDTPAQVRSAVTGDLGYILLLDSIKKDVTDESLELSVTDDQSEGRPLRVLNVAQKIMGGKRGSVLARRYWVDLRRGGHVVRQEWYLRGKEARVRLDVEVSRFKLGNSEVWMPTSGSKMSYVALVDKKPVITKEPSVIERIDVLRSTMQFNTHPGPEVFTIKYKPGTPISDSLRKVTYEFGQQKLPSEPKKADIEKMLREQIAEAQKQKEDLVVASSSDGLDRPVLFALAIGCLLAILLVLLWVQRRRH